VQNKYVIVLVDCTGHGVPGAFMSIISNDLIDHVFFQEQIPTAGSVLNEMNTRLNKKFVSAIDEIDTKQEIDDGMDVSVCIVDYDNMKLEFAGANHTLLFIRDAAMKEIKGDFYSLGKPVKNIFPDFSTHEISLAKGDVFYMFSDGYMDQFGGDYDRKYYYRNFRDFLFEMHKLPMSNQKKELEKDIVSWMGDNHQIDDILVIGVRI
jgi:serine phosphatase RsbU (regulator of sigma subunit)